MSARAAGVGGTLTALVLLCGSAAAWADEPSPEATPVAVDDSGMVDDPACTFVPGTPGDGGEEPTAEPTDVVTAEPDPGEGTGEDGSTGEATPEPTVDPTDEPAVDPTDEPTVDPTDEPAPDPTVDPTEDPAPDPTPGDGEDGYWVCAAEGMPAEGPLASSGGGQPTLGDGTVQLPFSGAPVGRYALTGVGLLLAGTGTVLVARRRQA